MKYVENCIHNKYFRIFPVEEYVLEKCMCFILEKVTLSKKVKNLGVF